MIQYAICCLLMLGEISECVSKRIKIILWLYSAEGIIYKT